MVKRKNVQIKTSKQHNLTQKKDLSLKFKDEEIDSGSSEDDMNGYEDEVSSDEEHEESAEQKRIRIAKDYLASMSGAIDGDESDDSEDKAAVVSEQLQKNRLLNQGKLFRKLAQGTEHLEYEKNYTIRYLSGHKLSVTCVALTSDDATAYSGSKDNALIQWDIETGNKHILKPYWSRKSHGTKQASDGEILAVAVSTDGKYVASGGRDNAIRIYDSRQKYAEVKVLQGHRDAVSCLSFRRNTNSLFSGSFDRCLKHWDLTDMAYIETMFGHQDTVSGLDCWTSARPISASADRSVRLWKVADDSHLVFQSHVSNVDTVQVLTHDSFLSGGQDGTIALWRESQKKPQAVAKQAHGIDRYGNANWICSLATVKESDLVASGSNDGTVRLWQAAALDRVLRETCRIPLGGFVNGLAVSPRLLVAGLGSEHRLGRWWTSKHSGEQSKIGNKVAIVRLATGLEQGSSIAEEDSDGEYADDSSGGEEEARQCV